MEGVYYGQRWTTWFLRKEGVKPLAICSLCRESPCTRTVQLGTEPQQSGAASSRGRKYAYSDQLRFLSKLIDERQTADSLSADNMEESQVTTTDQNRDDMNNFSQ